jgi:hypothetical protein
LSFEPNTAKPTLPATTQTLTAWYANFEFENQKQGNNARKKETTSKAKSKRALADCVRVTHRSSLLSLFRENGSINKQQQ